jgi:hypothetical protein
MAFGSKRAHVRSLRALTPERTNARVCQALQGRGVNRDHREVDMAKGEQRSNRETKKPKKEKVKTIAAAPSQKAAGWQPNVGTGKKK